VNTVDLRLRITPGLSKLASGLIPSPVRLSGWPMDSLHAFCVGSEQLLVENFQ
jgi:hypothetical protein